MEESEVLIMEDGARHCPQCLVGMMDYLGGPIGVGIPGAIDEEVQFLHKCDVCSALYHYRNEEKRVEMVEYHYAEYSQKLPEWREYGRLHGLETAEHSN